MAERDQQGLLRYVELTADCFQKRTLGEYAGAWSPCALSGGAVAAGDLARHIAWRRRSTVLPDQV
jgi:hypothetical protein